MAENQIQSTSNAVIEEFPDDPALRCVLLPQVLIEEYESMDQPELNAADQQRFQELKAQRILTGKAIEEIYKIIRRAQVRKIQEIRADVDNRIVEKFTTDTERQRVVDQAVLCVASKETKDLEEVLTDEYKRRPDRARGQTEDEYVKRRAIETFKSRTSDVDADRLAATTLRSALCLSGGGIRSATFNLGILQGLARHGLLDKFDYLSTVSGGGFIGGWLSAWKHRSGLPEVMSQLRNRPESPLLADPKPIDHLRVYSNYLSPQPGLLSADSWALVATLIRNLLLNWLVFIPVFVAVLVLPRMWASTVLWSGSYSDQWSLWIGVIAAIVALSYIALRLPSSQKPPDPHVSSQNKYKTDERPFIIGCLIWLIISAAALSVYLWQEHKLKYEPFLWWEYAVFGLFIVAVPWLLLIIKVWRNTTTGRFRLAILLLTATAIIIGIQFIIGYIAAATINVVLAKFFVNPIIYSIFSPPLILLLMSLEGVLLAGFTSRLTTGADQEWWARAGAWVLIAVFAWIVVHTLVLYGPLLILNLQDTFNRLSRSGSLRNLRWSDWGKLAGTVMGVVSGIITLVGGFSSKTPANDKEAQKAGTGGLLLAVLTQGLAPIFLGFIIILLSLLTNWLLISRPLQFFNQHVFQNYRGPQSSLSLWHYKLIEDSTFLALSVCFAGVFLIGLIMGRFISTNVFSLQYLWRNRIIRAYLGASNKFRNPNPFTNFDDRDNLFMHELWPQPGAQPATTNPSSPEKPFTKKLFHVLNVALNLTGGEKLQWQDRKAESFTVSPLHAGSYWLGYRRAAKYGGKEGITLGASVAISGAFVSPNMGFMMTSPVVRFLMALFNVRFGWWLGNPGPAGDQVELIERVVNFPRTLLGQRLDPPFREDSPRLSIIPFVSEATGNIDQKSSYVYLSDGGHFENLGLYEMVLRRCRFIVVSDATTDPDYAFESLAMSIRQIRVDLGVPIDLPELAVGVPSQNLKSKYCAIGKIRYSCVDRDPDDPDTKDEDFDGILILIKPSLIGEEPRDVINYWQGRSTFPQEVITDQWFSEAQFESYRALASYIIDTICDGSRNLVSMATFAEKVRDHNQLNPAAFKEEISYAALKYEFERGMAAMPVPSYTSKVRKFISNIVR